MWKAILVIAVFLAEGDARGCVPYTVDNQVLACVCNATYCDSAANYDPQALQDGVSYWYVTNKQGLRMTMSETKYGNCKSSPGDVKITVDTTKKYQKILGFGGAFTDSTGINLAKLSPATQEQLLRSYYDPKEGSRYNLGRIPIGGTDFSVRPYTYDDFKDDVTLKHFALQNEDHQFKIPYAKKALELNPDTKFFSAAWSAPGWMKTNGQFWGFGYLKKKYYQVYANYLVKFLEGYRKNGIEIWAITTGNEPTIYFEIHTRVISMGWTPTDMAHWIGSFMGPTLAKSGHNDTLILALDDDKFLLPRYVIPTYTNKKSNKYTAGTAVHAYFENYAPASVLTETHDAFPNKFILMTEDSIGPSAWGTKGQVTKSWNYGESYMLSIMEYLNNWAVGWVDWNLVLDESGGPTWINNTLNCPIIVNPSTDEFYKLPMYYAIQHFSRFVERGSVRVSVTNDAAVKTAAFLTPANDVVVVLYNNATITQQITLQDSQKAALCLELSPNSMNTVIYKN